MSVQSFLGDYSKGKTSRAARLPDPPDDDELKYEIAPDWAFPFFDVNEVDGVDRLRKRIRTAVYSDDPIEEWSYILGDHISYGNKKLSDSIAIFNMNSANDCINLGEENCQVGKTECYAFRSEFNFPNTLPFRRRQEIIWAHLDAVTWAKAFRRHLSRKQNAVTALRMSESGDFRNRHDILKVDEIARRVDDLVDTFTYTASDYLPWEEREHFTLNQSNSNGDYGDRRFEVVEDVDEIPSNGIRCPHDQSDGDILCGECQLCLNQDAPSVFVKKF